MDSNQKNFKRKNSILILLKIHLISENNQANSNNKINKHLLNSQPNKLNKLNQYNNQLKRVKKIKSKMIYNNFKLLWDNLGYKILLAKLIRKRRRKNLLKNRDKLVNKHQNNRSTQHQFNNRQCKHFKLINKNYKK